MYVWMDNNKIKCIVGNVAVLIEKYKGRMNVCRYRLILLRLGGERESKKERKKGIGCCL